MVIDIWPFIECSPGFAWEVALPLCAELAEQYRGPLLDYAKLGGILRLEAAYLEKILQGDKFREQPQVRRPRPLTGPIFFGYEARSALCLHSCVFCF